MKEEGKSSEQSKVEAELTASKVFDLSTPDAKDTLGKIGVERLNPSDKIIGLANWNDVKEVVRRFIEGLAYNYDPDPGVRNFVRFPHLQDSVESRDRKKGFYGTSKNFEMTILPTDISHISSGKKEKNPKLATTFELLRHLSNGNRIVKTECTISLTDRGSKLIPNFYDDSEDYQPGEELVEEIDKPSKQIRIFTVVVGLREIDETVLNAMNRSKRSAASFGENTNKRTGFRIKNQSNS